MSQKSILDKLTTKQIAIGGGILVAVLLTLGTVAASFAGWQAFTAIAEKREKERIAKEQAKAVDDFKNAVAKVFGKPREEKKIDWLTHDKVATLGDVQISVLGGDYGRLKYLNRPFGPRDTVDATAAKETANLRIRVTNVSKTKVVEYFPIHASGGGAITQDEHGNRCDLWRSPFTLATGHGISAFCKINPGEFVDDTLAFTPALPISTEFRIEIKGTSVGNYSNESAYFKIPRSFFVEKK